MKAFRIRILVAAVVVVSVLNFWPRKHDEYFVDEQTLERYSDFERSSFTAQIKRPLSHAVCRGWPWTAHISHCAYRTPQDVINRMHGKPAPTETLLFTHILIADILVGLLMVLAAFPLPLSLRLTRRLRGTPDSSNVGIGKVPRWAVKLRFGLTTSFLVVTGVCALLAYIASELQTTAPQRHTVQQLLRMGAVLSPPDELFFAPDRRPVVRRFVDPDRLTEPKEVYFSYLKAGKRTCIPMDDSTIQLVSQLSDVVGVRTNDSVMSDRGLARLCSTQRLRFLCVWSESITDEGIPKLRAMQQLEHLELRSSRITDASAPHIASLPHLRWLDLSDTSVTDRTLEHLTNCRSLETVYLDRTNITDAGVAHLRELPALRFASMKATAVTQRSITDLHQCIAHRLGLE